MTGKKEFQIQRCMGVERNGVMCPRGKTAGKHQELGERMEGFSSKPSKRLTSLTPQPWTLVCRSGREYILLFSTLSCPRKLMSHGHLNFFRI